MPISFTVSDVIPAKPSDIYDAWLSSDGHTAMTGGTAHANSEPGGLFDAWDGYIAGSNLILEPGVRIVQSWRTTVFKDTEPDSQIEVTLTPEGEATRIALAHTNVPDGGEHYQSGWQTHYFDPMKSYFSSA